MNKFAQHYFSAYVKKRAAAGEEMRYTERPSLAGTIVGANSGLKMRPSNYGFTSGPSMSNAPRPDPGAPASPPRNLLSPLDPNRPSSLKDRMGNLQPYHYDPNRPSLKDRMVPLQDSQSMSNAPRPNPVRPVQEATLGQSMSNAPRPNPVRPAQEAILGQYAR